MAIVFHLGGQDSDQESDQKSERHPGHFILSTPSYRSLNLLAHAQLLELDVGSRCGGHGICGGDRVRILEPGQGNTQRNRKTRSKFSPLTETERQHLTATEIEDGWRLACQCWIEEDDQEVQIEVSSK